MTHADRQADTNPYAPSDMVAAPPTDIPTNQDLNGIIRRFRTESRALAGYWIIFGCVLVLVGIYGAANLPASLREVATWDGILDVSCFLMGLPGLAWVLTGILTACRVERAIRIALIVNYLLLLFPPVWITVFGLFLLILGIPQAHRVLQYAKDIRASATGQDAAAI